MHILDYHDRVVAYNLQRLRKEFNLNQKDVAQILRVTPSTVGKMEKGLSEVSMDQAETLAKYFNVPVDLFLSTNHEYENEYREIDKLCKSKKLNEALERCKMLIKNTSHIYVFNSLVLNMLGKIYFLMGKHKMAYFAWYQMYERVKDLNDDILNYKTLYNLSLACYYLRDYKLSLKYIEEVLNNYNISNDWSVYNQRAILLIHENRTEEALGVLFEILGKFIKDNKISEAVRVIHNIGFAYEKQCEYEMAKFFFNQALMEGYELNEPDAIGVTAADLSEIYIREGNIQIAKKIIIDALSLDVPLHFEIRLKCLLSSYTENNHFKKQLLLTVVDKVGECLDHELVAKYYKQLYEVYKAEHNLVMALKYSELSNQRLEEKINNSLKDI